MRGVPRAPAGDLVGRRRLERHAQDAGGALHDRDEVGGVVVVEAGHEAEAIAQRAGDEAGAGGGAHEGEVRQLEPDRTRRRALADDDVELEVFHRRVEHLLDRAREAMDLVDEEHVTVVEVGEDRREVAGAFERGTTRDPQADFELGGDDARQRGLAEPGRAGEQDVVDRLPAPARRGEHDLEVLLQARLADELVEPAGPETRLLGHLHRIGGRHQHLFPRHGAVPIRLAPWPGA